MDRRLAILGILLFCMYYQSSRFSLDGYELEYVLSARNVYSGNGPALAPGFTDCPGIWNTDGDFPVYPRQNLLQTYLSVPFYAAGAFLFGESPTIENRGGYWELPWGPVMFVSILNSLSAAFLAVLVGLICLDIGIKPPGHYFMTVLFGITSMNWHYGAFGMEVLQTTVMVGAIGSAIRYSRTGKISWFVTAVCLLPALANCKKVSFLFVLPIAVYLVWSVSVHKPVYTKFAVVLLIVCVTAGFGIMTASLLMRFRADPNLLPHLLRTYLESGPKTVDLVFALAISPGQGFLVFNPLLWFAIPAWAAFYRSHRPEALLFATVLIITGFLARIIPYILIDEAWGPRYLFVLLPLAYIAGAKELIKNRQGLAKKLFIAILIVSVLFQWLSSMYAGFQLNDIPLIMGVTDYMLTVWTPSLSQIWLAGVCFISHLNRLRTSESLTVKHRQYETFTGHGGSYHVMRLNLDTYDNPVGGWFIVRWVLSEKGFHRLTGIHVLLIRIFTDVLLAGSMVFILKKSKRSVV